MRLPFTRPALDVDQLARAVAASLRSDGTLALPEGARALTEAQSRAQLDAVQSRVLLPRNPIDGMVPFGPGIPLAPAPIDPMEGGVVPPRRWEYPLTWNLQLFPERHTPWAILKAVAEQCDVVRHCIELRKTGLVARNWDITLRPAVIARMMAQTGTKSRAKAAALARDQYGPHMERIARFLETPDLGQSWSQWANAILEQEYVYDAPTVWPRWTLGRECVGWKIIDGSTIKPLLDHLGDRPQPPAPAFQQILYGFPRGEFTASAEHDGEFSTAQLFYRPRNERPDSPYGFSCVEQAIPAADLWLKRQAWMRAEYTDGASPRMGIVVKNKDDWSPAQYAAWQRVYNTRVAGQTSERQRAQLFPNGMEPVLYPNLDALYKPDYDEALRKWIASIFGVMPTQIGVIPNQGIGGRGQFEGEQNQIETVTQRPLEEWFIDLVNDLAVATQGMPRELTLTFSGNELDEEALMHAQRQQAQTGSGARTLNDVRAEDGLDLYDFPEADMPFISTPTGPVFLQGAATAQAEPGTAPDAPAAPTPNAGDPRSQEPQEPQGASPDTEAELRAFAGFARKRKGGAWRDFVFRAVPPELARACNRLAQRGELDAAIALARAPGTVPPKASAPPPDGALPPSVAAGDALAQGQASAVRDAIAAGRSREAVLAAARAAVLAHGGQAPAQLAAVVRDALAPLVPDPSTLDLVIQRLWGMAWAESEPESPAAGIVWRDWEPGDPEAARLIHETPGLSQLLHDAGIWIKDIDETTVDRLGTSLADGLDAGEGSDALAQRVDAVIHDPSRALMIARTEAARAMELASEARAVAQGQTQKRWLDLPDACPACRLNAEAGWVPIVAAFPGGASRPPQHPWCRCSTAYRRHPTE